ncbi:MAG: RluA family pseudouridine synthase [Pseudomonadota bacterium]
MTDETRADAPADDEASDRLVLEIDAALAGLRLDKALATAFPSLSRARFQALIRDRRVAVDGDVSTDAKLRLRVGQQLSADLPELEDAEPKPEAIPLGVVFEDDQVIVVDKPSGLVVHPGPGHGTGTLVNALLAHCGASLAGVGGVRRPGIVHRLDRETSGLIVAAKTDRAHQSLSGQFASHGRDGRLQRQYRAFVWGRPDRPIGTVDAPLGRSSTHRTRMAVVGEGQGRHAVTHYTVAASFAAGDGAPHVASEMVVTLETGRTHQIRVHMAHIRAPILGDPVYGAHFQTRTVKLAEGARAALAALKRQALHAELLGFEHPVTGDALSFTSTLPADLAALKAALERGET